MIKKCLLTASLSFVFFLAQAQDSIPKVKKFDNYVGVQINQLLKQILNKNSTETNNPYLLTYSLNNAKKGWGLQTGLGYLYQKTHDANTPANHTSKINEFYYRLGVCRKVRIGKYLLPGFGLDFIGDYRVDKTYTVSVTNTSSLVDSSESVVTSKITSFGGGPQLSLGFIVTPGLIIGTEATCYFLKSTNKQNVYVEETITNNFNGVSTKTSSNTNDKVESSKFVISVPVAIFLIVKF